MMAIESRQREYSFLLHTCNVGDSAEVVTNPFTGEAIEVVTDIGLTHREVKELRRVFEQNHIAAESHGEGYASYPCQDSCLRFRCNDLDSDIPIRGIATEITASQLSDELLDVLLDVARVGNLAFTSPVGDRVRLVDRLPNPKLLGKWPDAQVLSTTLELRHWLEESIGGRRVYASS